MTTKREYLFPEGFLWGAATAAHQVEGNNLNSESWVLEHLPETIYVEPSGDACDHYHRYPEDIALLAELGFNAYRFSVEWARIEPEEGEFSYAELEHYRRVLAACHEHGIQPMVTLHHFTTPRWLMHHGGWLDDKTPERFARYSERVGQHLGDLMAAACTFNEPNLAVLLSKIIPFKLDEGPHWDAAAQAFGVTRERLGLFQFTTNPKMRDVMFDAHRRAFDILHAGPGDFPVGLTLALIDVQAAAGGESQAAEMRYAMSDQYLKQLCDDDFVGVQTYERLVVGPDGIIHPDDAVEKNQTGQEFYPEAIGDTIRHAAKVTGIPVIVTENGLASTDDAQRVRFFQRALRAVADTIEAGLDVRGYFAWSLMDNFEWNSGYDPKFGIIAVDRTTQQRTPKPSAYWLGKVARNNRIRFE